MIELPSNLVVSCAGISYSAALNQAAASCSKATGTNAFTFTSVFSSTYVHSSSTTLTILFTNVFNPGSVQSVAGLKINTYDTVSSAFYLVDSYSDTTELYETTQSIFKAASVSADTDKTYTSAKFSFTIILDNQVP